MQKCFKCNENYLPGHICNQTEKKVQHIFQQGSDMFGDTDFLEENSDCNDDDTSIIYAISSCDDPKTPRFQVETEIFRKSILGLINTGSDIILMNKRFVPDSVTLIPATARAANNSNFSNLYRTKHKIEEANILDQKQIKSRHYLFMTDDTATDLILGLKWCFEAKPRIDWTTKTVSLVNSDIEAGVKDIPESLIGKSKFLTTTPSLVAHTVHDCRIRVDPSIKISIQRYVPCCYPNTKL
jgi:hypothetical protein